MTDRGGQQRPLYTTHRLSRHDADYLEERRPSVLSSWGDGVMEDEAAESVGCMGAVIAMAAMGAFPLALFQTLVVVTSGENGLLELLAIWSIPMVVLMLGYYASRDSSGKRRRIRLILGPQAHVGGVFRARMEFEPDVSFGGYQGARPWIKLVCVEHIADSQPVKADDGSKSFYHKTVLWEEAVRLDPVPALDDGSSRSLIAFDLASAVSVAKPTTIRKGESPRGAGGVSWTLHIIVGGESVVSFDVPVAETDRDAALPSAASPALQKPDLALLDEDVMEEELMPAVPVPKPPPAPMPFHKPLYAIEQVGVEIERAGDAVEICFAHKENRRNLVFTGFALAVCCIAVYIGLYPVLFFVLDFAMVMGYAAFYRSSVRADEEEIVVGERLLLWSREHVIRREEIEHLDVLESDRNREKRQVAVRLKQGAQVRRSTGRMGAGPLSMFRKHGITTLRHGYHPITEPLPFEALARWIRHEIATCSPFPDHQMESSP
jgi:hypothetical protein